MVTHPCTESLSCVAEDLNYDEMLAATGTMFDLSVSASSKWDSHPLLVLIFQEIKSHCLISIIFLCPLLFIILHLVEFSHSLSEVGINTI